MTNPMHRIYLLISFLLLISEAGAGQQRLDPERYHMHRNTLRNSWFKFNEEKKGRVAFLGGSITFNPGWRDSICGYLTYMFPETTFDFINAGIPSMGSTPGAFRFRRDVLKNGIVDLLFVEAAVNDDTNRRTSEEIIRAMEGITRHALTANPYCDIVFVYFADPGKTDEYRMGITPEVIRLHEKVADHYGISSINLAREVTERIIAGEFNWEDDFKNLHPSPFGQQVYFLSMKQFLEQAWLKVMPSDKPASGPTPGFIDRFSYSNGALVEPVRRQVNSGWWFEENWQPELKAGTRDNFVNVPVLVGTHPGAIVTFKFVGNAVGIVVIAGPDAGKIEYRIDRGAWHIQDLFTAWSRQLYLPWYYTLAGGLKSMKHTLHIRVIETHNASSTGTHCVIRYFYYNAID